MPTKPETLFYRRVNKPLPHDLHFQKIGAASENGTADFWYSGNKADGWIEFKWEPRIPAIGVDPLKLLSALQALWINRRYKEGRYVAVIIGTPAGCVVLENGAWNNRVSAEQFVLTSSEVSDFLSGKFYDAHNVPKPRSFGD
jgi:hypothetical protein